MDGSATGMPAGAPAGPDAVRTTCPYCGVGCGILATPDGNGGLAIAGDPAHPANRGRLRSKGTALAETVGLHGRLLHPLVHGKQTPWNEALDLVATRFSQTIARHGPDSVAFYVSGQMLTEDYYVANKLMKGFIGSANIDTNSRLCMASTVAGHRRAFGDRHRARPLRGPRAGRPRRSRRLEPRLVPPRPPPAPRRRAGPRART